MPTSSEDAGSAIALGNLLCVLINFELRKLFPTIWGVMREKIFHALSVLFFGVFVGPIFSMIWFFSPWLRYFPVGDDSPSFGGAFGFCVGALIAVYLNKSCHWGKLAAFLGLLLMIATILVYWSVVRDWETGSPGIIGVWILGLHAIVSALGLTLAGLFSYLGSRSFTAKCGIE